MNIVQATRNRQLYVLIKFPVEFDWFLYFCISAAQRSHSNAANAYLASDTQQHTTQLYINYLSIRKLPSIHCACFHRPNNEIDTEHDTNDHKCDFYMSLANGFVLRLFFGRTMYNSCFLSEFVFSLVSFFPLSLITYACLTPILHIFYNIIAFGISFHSFRVSFFPVVVFFFCLIFKRMDIIALNASQQPINWRRNEIVWSTRVISSALKEFQEPQGNWFLFFSRTLNCTNVNRFFFHWFYFSHDNQDDDLMFMQVKMKNTGKTLYLFFSPHFASLQ